MQALIPCRAPLVGYPIKWGSHTKNVNFSCHCLTHSRTCAGQDLASISSHLQTPGLVS